MKARHTISENKWERDVEDNASFLLGNKLGDYAWFADGPESRYQGWFVSFSYGLKEEMYKIIEDIRPANRSSVSEIDNHFSKVQRKGDSFKESFSIPENKHCLIYELKEKRRIELVLDMRNSYGDDYSEYEIKESDGRLLVKAETENETFFLAITGYDNFEKISERFVRYYNLDKKRNSPPFEKAVYKALILEGKKLLFSAFKNKEKAEMPLNDDLHLKNLEKNKNEPVDFVAAKTGLENLIVDEKERIFAGFPWFFQFWKRDEAISLGGLNVINKQKAKDVFRSLLENKNNDFERTDSADGVGWVFKRAFLFLNEFSDKEEKKLATQLRRCVDFNSDEVLKTTEPKGTWMDSISREGARIEMQALWLNMYKLGKIIDSEKKADYRKMEEDLKKKVYNVFWDGYVLADGYLPGENRVDKTIRPNLFLAYYIYPELLSDQEWKNCFRRALHELWLDWGGIATISKEDSRFNSTHTGENSQSYHQGDSWFFINNFAAICMNRLDEGKFSYEINKILEASRENLLWKGAIGHHSELSSAKSLEAEGAISQAWSFSTYLEAMYEIFKIKNYSWS